MVFRRKKKILRKGGLRYVCNQWLPFNCRRLTCLSGLTREPLQITAPLLQSIHAHTKRHTHTHTHTNTHTTHTCSHVAAVTVCVCAVHHCFLLHQSYSHIDPLTHSSDSSSFHLSSPPITGLCKRCCLDKLFSYGILKSLPSWTEMCEMCVI